MKCPLQNSIFIVRLKLLSLLKAIFRIHISTLNLIIAGLGLLKRDIQAEQVTENFLRLGE